MPQLQVAVQVYYIYICGCCAIGLGARGLDRCSLQGHLWVSSWRESSHLSRACAAAGYTTTQPYRQRRGVKSK